MGCRPCLVALLPRASSWPSPSEVPPGPSRRWPSRPPRRRSASTPGSSCSTWSSATRRAGSCATCARTRSRSSRMARDRRSRTSASSRPGASPSVPPPGAPVPRDRPSRNRSTSSPCSSTSWNGGADHRPQGRARFPGRRPPERPLDVGLHDRPAHAPPAAVHDRPRPGAGGGRSGHRGRARRTDGPDRGGDARGTRRRRRDRAGRRRCRRNRRRRGRGGRCGGRGRSRGAGRGLRPDRAEHPRHDGSARAPAAGRVLDLRPPGPGQPAAAAGRPQDDPVFLRRAAGHVAPGAGLPLRGERGQPGQREHLLRGRSRAEHREPAHRPTAEGGAGAAGRAAAADVARRSGRHPRTR